MKVVSLFAGAGGLDLGFSKAGFDIIYANEKDSKIWETYEFNHPNTILDKRSIVDIKNDDIPSCDGIIGGPPCQSWSAAGAGRGVEDARGLLFFEFIRILEAKKPIFFLAENVKGMLAKKHSEALKNIKQLFIEAGYDLHFKLMNSADYGIAQDRERVIFIGFRSDMNINFEFPKPITRKKFLKDIIFDLKDSALPAIEKSKPNPSITIANHEYMTGDFSPRFMSRNRVRNWDEVAFTVQASGRHATLHPNAPKMVKIGVDKFAFVNDSTAYRRLSVRESARIQGFPDHFIFKYENLNEGYKMIGNAVNVDFAEILASSIKKAIQISDI